MLRAGMYVRCPIDDQHPDEPRTFAAGKITDVNEYSQMATISFLDPFDYSQFYDVIPAKAVEKNIRTLERCVFKKGDLVSFRGRKAKILVSQDAREIYNWDECGKLYSYVIQDLITKEVRHISEKELTVPFTYADPDPLNQLRHFEFQNPRWYLKRQVVLKNLNALNNSIHGFKTLAGCRIYLKAFQLNTIMRCLQSNPMRFMIADEVGLGKTIEVCSILKIYLESRQNQKVLIVVPSRLCAQWETEMIHKFGLYKGENNSGNIIALVPTEKIADYPLMQEWDFLIVDEVHNDLADRQKYDCIHKLSKLAKNVFMLSATPIQQGNMEYLKLLRLILPEKYDAITLKEFKEIVEKQVELSKNTAIAIDAMEGIRAELLDLKNDGEDIHNDDDLQDELQDLVEQLEEISESLSDSVYDQIVSTIDIHSDDLGIRNIELAISYVCENYQLESNMIRGRRSLLEGQFSKREKIDIPYSFENGKLLYEGDAYHALVNWVSEQQSQLDDEKINSIVIPLLKSFFSSPWAYMDFLKKFSKKINIPEEVMSSARVWLEDENNISQKIVDAMDDPEEHPSRIVQVMNACLNNVPFGKKAVIFTDFEETFKKYLQVFQDYYGNEEAVGYGKCLTKDEYEKNMYVFQTNPNCHYLICDRSGGEGRNMQMADFMIHVDLPWNISDLEQRIGRLDRLGRNVDIPVTSIVVHSSDSYEEQLFKLWDEGLHVFNESLSGLEILMNRLSKELNDAIKKDFAYGFTGLVPKMLELAQKTKKLVKFQQENDTAALKFQPLYRQLEKILWIYENNDSDLFGISMRTWAGMAGFGRPFTVKGTTKIGFDFSKFSFNAAANTYFIPPDWTNYLKKVKREELLDMSKVAPVKDDNIHYRETIWGTFDRKTSIENDYIHFFAPGDEIFDSILHNAIHSYKGMCCAFEAASEFNWGGFIFTFSIHPNESILIDHGLSSYDISLFRSYLPSMLKTIPMELGAESKDRDEVLQAYNQLFVPGCHIKIRHLGKRAKNGNTGLSPIETFKSYFDAGEWEKIVNKAAQEAFSIAQKQFDKESDLIGVETMMDRIIAAKRAVSILFYKDQIETESRMLKKRQEIILQSLKDPVIQLESVCFMRLREDEQGTNS